MSADSRPSQTQAEGSPLRVFALGAIVIIVVIAALLTTIRFVLFPVWEANSEGAHQVATAQVQLSAAMTQEALTPVPTSTPAAAATPQPAIAPTLAEKATPSAPEPTAVPLTAATPVPASAAMRTNLPTPTADQAGEIAVAYRNYFEVTGEALLNLDPSQLDQVAAGQSLAGLQQSIEDDRAQGRALQTDIQHEQVYVLDVHDDQADVADRYRDSSIYVDPQTHAPLPGQIAPASPDVAPAVSVVYHLQRIDGVWKVVSGQRFVPQGGE